MTDRELLEAAAKASNLNVVWNEGLQRMVYFVGSNTGTLLVWNPLADDGDALRLAVRLRIDVKWHSGLDDSVFTGVAYKQNTQVRERLNEDDYAATRRAIVRAAVAMGGGDE